VVGSAGLSNYSPKSTIFVGIGLRHSSLWQTWGCSGAGGICGKKRLRISGTRCDDVEYMRGTHQRLLNWKQRRSSQAIITYLNLLRCQVDMSEPTQPKETKGQVNLANNHAQWLVCRCSCRASSWGVVLGLKVVTAGSFFLFFFKKRGKMPEAC
jgi:hypothetical protein